MTMSEAGAWAREAAATGRERGERGEAPSGPSVSSLDARVGTRGQILTPRSERRYGPRSRSTASPHSRLCARIGQRRRVEGCGSEAHGRARRMLSSPPPESFELTLDVHTTPSKPHRPSATMKHPINYRCLPHLPAETYSHILSFCEPDVLADASRVSLAFLELAGPILYRHVTITGLNQLDKLFHREASAIPVFLPCVPSLTRRIRACFRRKRPARRTSTDSSRSTRRTPSPSMAHLETPTTRLILV